ncbi:Alpha/Beta hydrolase protein [Penicillium chermesinum]|uniref:Alpha/Beta hydrolase protein n=1 Tax=Penicillium chermesinum TaxID=63820 RepID=A0A9W9NP46_9EURO|nr:Alpha/Beta hydrolase protein [Penicillium chermesinum]KAJ5223406.1 Alpha/Beta hydrolase protein [Penicillium chermesinum]KAJ6155755.1 Alpha/Beta hydrolase protein [Penicillium chermesinum]
MSTPSNPSITLDRSFEYPSATHSYRVRWTVLGHSSNPPLIFIHGTPWSSKVWYTYAEAFAKYFRVYLFDNPGFGESPLGQPLPEKQHLITEDIALDADLAQQSEVFAALYKFWERDWKDGQRAHVVAHDHGGLMSLRAFLLHDCVYASLCLIDVVAIGPFGKPLFKLVAENENIFHAFTGPVFEGVVESYIRDAAHTEIGKETMHMLKAPWINTEQGRKGFVRQMAQANSRNTDEIESRYPEIGRRISIRIIWGKEDKWLPVEGAYRLAEKLNISPGDVAEIEGAGHLVMYDQEGKLGVELGVWLSQTEK